jgi:hypothetical protein
VSAPDWTDRNDSDPGITLLQVLPWLAAGLLFTAGAVAARRRRRRALPLGDGSLSVPVRDPPGAMAVLP